MEKTYLSCKFILNNITMNLQDLHTIKYKYNKYQ